MLDIRASVVNRHSTYMFTTCPNCGGGQFGQCPDSYVRCSLTLFIIFTWENFDSNNSTDTFKVFHPKNSTVYFSSTFITNIFTRLCTHTLTTWVSHSCRFSSFSDLFQDAFPSHCRPVLLRMRPQNWNHHYWGNQPGHHRHRHHHHHHRHHRPQSQYNQSICCNGEYRTNPFPNIQVNLDKEGTAKDRKA